MIRRAVLAITFTALALATTVRLVAQEYRGTIQGTIADTSGAVVPHATIAAKSSTQDYTVHANEKGYFVIPLVQPGTYTLAVDAAGFKRALRENVAVSISQRVDVPITLPIGAVSETVTVSESQVELATTDASGGTVMDPEKTENLPLNGRQLYSLLGLVPGVKNLNTAGSNGVSGQRAWDVSKGYSITGQQGGFNQFLLNGAPVSVQGGGAIGEWNISPTVDAVEEFKVMTITFDAQYGRIGGGAVNTIIKSGSPHVHGTLFDYWRNSVLDANRWDDNYTLTPKGYHNQHDFGGTVGGPILHDKLFFFASWESWREVLPNGGTTGVFTVPGNILDSQGNANLTGLIANEGHGNIYDPATTTCAQQGPNGCNLYNRSPFPNNTIPAQRISPAGLAILNLFPQANRANGLGNYVYTSKAGYSYDMPIGRVDYNISDKTKFYALYASWKGTENRLTNGIPGPAAYGNINHTRQSWTSVLDLTHAFNSRFVADVRGSFNRYVELSPDGSLAGGTASLTPSQLHLNMPSTTSSRSLAPEIDFFNDPIGTNTGTLQIPRLIGNYVSPNIFETYDISPSLTQTLGHHTVHYGGQFQLYHDVQSGVGLANGAFHFGSAFTQQNPLQRSNTSDGNAIADLLLGYPDGGQVDYAIQPYESYRYFGFFGQDDWKVNSKLALNLGLRWDEERSPIERHNRLLAGVCLTCVDPVSSKLNYPAGNVLPNGFAFPNPIHGTILFAGPDQPAYPNNNGYWQPKIGVSYNPVKWMVVHGGFTLGKALGAELGGSSPWNYTTQYQSSLDGGVTPTNNFALGNPFPNGAVTPPGASIGPSGLDGDRIGTDQPDRQIPHTRQYTLGIESEVPGNMIFNIAYLGAYTTGLRASKQLNGLNPSDFYKGQQNPGYLNNPVPNPFYGVLSKASSMGASPTIAARYLMVPYPQYHADLFDYTYPAGYSSYNSMVTSLEKHFSGGNPLINKLSFLVSFTWSKAMSATNLLNNSGAGLVDANPRYELDGSDRPWDLAVSGLYGLPFGKGERSWAVCMGLRTS